MRIIVFHNIADDAGRRMFDGYALGDPLVPVIEYARGEEREIVALEEAFFLFNEGTTGLATRYRSEGNRSLSVGDVVRCNDSWYTCERAGWKLLDVAPDESSIVERNAYGTRVAHRCLRCGRHALVFAGSYGAPGVGSSWECTNCGESHSRVGDAFSLASDGAHILRPEDVI